MILPRDTTINCFDVYDSELIVYGYIRMFISPKLSCDSLESKSLTLVIIPNYIKNFIIHYYFDIAFQYIQNIRIELSDENNPPADLIANSEIIPNLIYFLNFNDTPKLQHECALDINQYRIFYNGQYK